MTALCILLYHRQRDHHRIEQLRTFRFLPPTQLYQRRIEQLRIPLFLLRTELCELYSYHRLSCIMACTTAL